MDRVWYRGNNIGRDRGKINFEIERRIAGGIEGGIGGRIYIVMDRRSS